MLDVDSSSKASLILPESSSFDAPYCPPFSSEWKINRKVKCQCYYGFKLKLITGISIWSKIGFPWTYRLETGDDKVAWEMIWFAFPLGTARLSKMKSGLHQVMHLYFLPPCLSNYSFRTWYIANIHIGYTYTSRINNHEIIILKYLLSLSTIHWVSAMELFVSVG